MLAFGHSRQQDRIFLLIIRCETTILSFTCLPYAAIATPAPYVRFFFPSPTAAAAAAAVCDGRGEVEIRKHTYVWWCPGMVRWLHTAMKNQRNKKTRGWDPIIFLFLFCFCFCSLNFAIPLFIVASSLLPIRLPSGFLLVLPIVVTPELPRISAPTPIVVVVVVEETTDDVDETTTTSIQPISHLSQNAFAYYGFLQILRVLCIQATVSPGQGPGQCQGPSGVW